MKNDKIELSSHLPSDQMLEQGLTEARVYPSKFSPEWGSYNSNSYGEEKDVHLRDYLRQLRRHKWLIISLVTIVTTLVAVQAYRIKPWYTASTLLQIGAENSVVLKSGDVTLNGDTDWDYTVTINTKKLALENPELYKKVADDLQLDQNAEVLAALQKKPTLAFLYSSDKAENGDTEVLKNNSRLKEVKVTNAQVAAAIQSNVIVEQVKNTRAIKISYTNENPELAAKITNSIAQNFMDASFSNQTERFTTSVNWLDTSTRELKAKVQIAEEALANYTRANQIYSTEGGEGSKGSTLTISKLTQLHDQFVRVQSERLLKKSLYEQVQAGRIAELPEAFSDPKITQLQQELSKLETQASELKVKFGPSNPKMMEVQNQIAVLTAQIENSRKALEAKLKADYERSVQDEKSLSAALGGAKVAAVDENQASIKYNILKQDVATARGLYTDFLQNTNQAKARAAEQNNNIKFIQQAPIPTSPVGPKRLTMITMGFLLSLVAGIGLSLFLEYLDNTIKSLDDVDRYVQLPTLGIIPSISANAKTFLVGQNARKRISTSEDGSQLGLTAKNSYTPFNSLINSDSYAMIKEAYRAIRTSLLLSTAEAPPKIILVTSGSPSEGKSTTVVNLAISLAELGAKVLVIDCDLRRPSVHKYFDISSVNGLTNYLAGSIGADEAIQDLEIANLSVMPSGPIPPNPAELLSSQKMKDMLKLLGSSYDHIVLDSPPVVNVTDPVILSTIVDGTVFVVHAGKTTREITQRARQELMSVNSKILGVVLNNVNLRKDGYDYYSYYRYSSHYASHNDKDSFNQTKSYQ